MSRSFCGFAPCNLSMTFPPLTKRNVGMADTLYFAAVSGSSSTSTFKKITVSYSSLISLYKGAIALQGPHQLAVKSMTTNNSLTDASWTMSSTSSDVDVSTNAPPRSRIDACVLLVDVGDEAEAEDADFVLNAGDVLSFGTPNGSTTTLLLLETEADAGVDRCCCCFCCCCWTLAAHVAVAAAEDVIGCGFGDGPGHARTAIGMSRTAPNETIMVKKTPMVRDIDISFLVFMLWN
mmetsp:Transcript_55279/g.134269  ORF Transcript_55279/g.134269 Transcript_55279/m.134269 type:complete len:235 (+) Transcript_55279:349-1053(+)